MADSSSAYKYPKYDVKHDWKAYAKARRQPETAVKHDPKAESKPRRAESKKIQPIQKVAKKHRKAALKLVVSALFILSIAFVILFRYSMITEANARNDKLQSEYNQIADENKRINVEIDSNVNLSKVEDIAINRLGMKKPEKYQTVYINVIGDDFVTVPDGTTTGPLASNTVGSEFYATIIKTLGNVLEYLY